MAATAQDIKDFFALSGNNPAVTNDHLIRFAAALGPMVNEGDPTPATPDQLVDFLYSYCVRITLAPERKAAAAAVTF